MGQGKEKLGEGPGKRLNQTKFRHKKWRESKLPRRISPRAAKNQNW